jgi:two-component system, NtrC family, response regulator AtoC
MNEEIKSNITIIEDNELYSMLFRERLKDNLNFNLNVYDSAEDFFKNNEFEKKTDIVILDYKLPGINGLNTLKRIKESHPDSEVIMLSGQTNLQTVVEIMKAGAFDYITKNDDAIEKVFLSIRKALENKQMRNENISLKIQLNKYKFFIGILGFLFAGMLFFLYIADK